MTTTIFRIPYAVATRMLGKYNSEIYFGLNALLEAKNLQSHACPCFCHGVVNVEISLIDTPVIQKT